MKYAILVYETAEELAERADPAKADAYWGAYSAYGRMLSEAGVMAGGLGLQAPETATTLRQRGGARNVQDGPFAETKEQLGGFYVIEVADLDAALDWAAKCPAASRGAIEVRPAIVM